MMTRVSKSHPRQFMSLIVTLGCLPLLFWFSECVVPLSGPPLQAQVDAVRCFNSNVYTNIITGVVIGLIVLVVWLKYKKQICGCES